MGPLYKLEQLREEAEGAERTYQRAVDAGDVNALFHMTAWGARAGELDRAERAAQRSLDAGRPFAMLYLADALPEESADAERMYLLASNAGDGDATYRLARRRDEAGDTSEAERLYRLAIERSAGYQAIDALARLYERTGDTESAHRVQRFGLEADGSPAAPW